MGISDFIILSRFRIGIYSFTLFLVLMFGLILMSTMDISEPKGPLTVQDVAIQRNVASLLPSVVATPKMREFAPIVMEIDCSDISDRPPVTVKTKHLRLKTKGCKPSSVFNQNNDFEATLFELSQDSYSTDYISLAAGENQLVILRDGGESYPIAISLRIVSQ